MISSSFSCFTTFYRLDPYFINLIYYQMVQLYCLSRDPGEIFTRCPKILPFKKHPTDILQDKNHLYGIALAHIMHKTALNTTKHLQVARYRIFKNRQNLNFIPTA